MNFGPTPTQLALMKNIFAGKFKEAITLLEQNPTLNVNFHVDALKSELYAVTPLHMAAYFADLKLVRALIKCGANVDALDSGSKTPLHYAVSGKRQTPKNEREVIISLFAYLKPELLTMADNFGNMPLHLAAIENRVEAAKELLDRDNDLLYFKNKNENKTALELVQELISEDTSCAPEFEAMLTLLNRKTPSLTYICNDKVGNARPAYASQFSNLPEQMQMDIHTVYTPLAHKLIHKVEMPETAETLTEKMSKLGLS